MEGMTFLALRCFSCQIFQVNQRTKSGKWKCRVCSEGQSIVKVWGRGGHAKDIRGLVMELNAAVGRGEDPTTAVTHLALQREAPQQQQQQQRQGIGSAATGGRDRFPLFVSENSRSGGPPRPRTCAAGGAQAGAAGATTTAFRGGFVPAGLAPSGVDPASENWMSDSSCRRTDNDDPFALRGEGRAWDENREQLEYGRGSFPRESTEYRGQAARGSPRRFEGLRERSTSAWTTMVGKPSGSQGSRWGAFSSERSDDSRQRGQRARGVDRHHHPQQGDPHFVLSLPQQPSACDRRVDPGSERRGRKRGLQATTTTTATTTTRGSTGAEARTRRTLDDNAEEAYPTTQSALVPSTNMGGLPSKARRCEGQSYAGHHAPVAGLAPVSTLTGERGGREGQQQRSSVLGRSHRREETFGVFTSTAGDSSEFMFSRRVSPESRPTPSAGFGADEASSLDGTNTKKSPSSSSRWSNFVR